MGILLENIKQENSLAVIKTESPSELRKRSPKISAKRVEGKSKDIIISITDDKNLAPKNKQRFEF